SWVCLFSRVQRTRLRKRPNSSGSRFPSPSCVTTRTRRSRGTSITAKERAFTWCGCGSATCSSTPRRKAPSRSTPKGEGGRRERRSRRCRHPVRTDRNLGMEVPRRGTCAAAPVPVRPERQLHGAPDTPAAERQARLLTWATLAVHPVDPGNSEHSRLDGHL